MFEIELNAVKNDLEMLRTQRNESKKIINREIRKPIVFKIRELRLILKEIEAAIIEILEIERLFPDFKGSKKDEANKLLENLAHSVEQIIYWYENQEIAQAEQLAKDMKEHPFDKDKISEDKLKLEKIENIEIQMIRDFRRLLQKLESLLKDHDKNNKDENEKVDHLLKVIKKMLHQFKLIIKASVMELRLVRI